MCNKTSWSAKTVITVTTEGNHHLGNKHQYIQIMHHVFYVTMVCLNDLWSIEHIIQSYENQIHDDTTYWWVSTETWSTKRNAKNIIKCRRKATIIHPKIIKKSKKAIREINVFRWFSEMLDNARVDRGVNEFHADILDFMLNKMTDIHTTCYTEQRHLLLCQRLVWHKR